jgi:hypothetical protein
MVLSMRCFISRQASGIELPCRENSAPSISRGAFLTADIHSYRNYRRRAPEGEHVARIWFNGATPWLDYETPIMAIREDRLKDVGNAARALIDDGFSG